MENDWTLADFENDIRVPPQTLTGCRLRSFTRCNCLQRSCARHLCLDFTEFHICVCVRGKYTCLDHGGVPGTILRLQLTYETSALQVWMETTCLAHWK